MTRSRTIKRHARQNLRHVTTCGYCGKTGDGTGIDGRPWHLDHVDPISRGGADNLANIVKCCAPCNLKKGNKQWVPQPETLCGTGQIYDPKTATISSPFVGSPHQERYHTRNYELQQQVNDLKQELYATQRQLEIAEKSREFYRDLIDQATNDFRASGDRWSTHCRSLQSIIQTLTKVIEKQNALIEDRREHGRPQGVERRRRHRR